jgi:glycine betaine/proline transport system substrate-binding protein
MTQTTTILALSSLFLTTPLIAHAASAELPGQGISVQPIESNVAEENFQTLLVSKMLEKLGYDVQPAKDVDYNVGYTTVAHGDGTFLTFNWEPLHDEKYEKAGGNKVFYRKGNYVTGAAQGYLIDKKTADTYHITNIAQLNDPKLAKLFDTNGDGKADLTGCNPGWGCESAINYQLKAYHLENTVQHNQGNYSALIADTLTHFKQGKPIFYYTWTPYWVSSELVPGKDVVWLQVPFSATPGKAGDTQLPNGKNYGFRANTMHIVANRSFAEKNPAAATLFSVVKLSVADINAQNLLMKKGENKPTDIDHHADAWLNGHTKQVNAWLTAARAAARTSPSHE